MSALLDGSAWVAVESDASHTSYHLEVKGADAAGVVIVMAVWDVAGPGTYSLVPGNTLAAVISDKSIFVGSDPNGGGGSITFTSITESAVIGTFSFEAVGDTGIRMVTRGQFNIPLP